MCGIAGLYNFKGNQICEETLKEMTVTLEHRGPDFGSTWCNHHVGLGHRLLKIQDLSEQSHQPFKYKDYVMSFNGEIYNHENIREELKRLGYEFTSSSDTEVLIKAYDYWGIDLLEKLNGCFVFAIYDLKKEELLLVRDRFGIKPLHYIVVHNELIFASEIKSILKHSKVEKKADLNSIGLSLVFKLWMPPNKTFFKNIHTLEPGKYLRCTKKGMEEIDYYDIEMTNTLKDEDHAVETFRKKLKESVNRRLISKVPVAAFLSGGIDSSLICKFAQDHMEDCLNTYTIYYNNDSDCDLNHANELVNNENLIGHNILIKDDHYEITSIDTVIRSMEEILMDKVYVPVYYNYKAAKDEGFTVILNGQGSDEAWLGYIYTWYIFEQLKEKASVDYLANKFYPQYMVFGDKVKPEFKTNMNLEIKNHLDHNMGRYFKDDTLNTYSIFAVRTILHNLLMQEDKLSMAHAVEARVPFVDHEVIELAMSVPSELKTKDGREKYILRKSSKGLLPDSIINRFKYPFPEPPNIYNQKIKNVCQEYWKSICQSKILTSLMSEEYFDSINNFSDLELWWILVIWRFEKVFDLEV